MKRNMASESWSANCRSSSVTSSGRSPALRASARATSRKRAPRSSGSPALVEAPRPLWSSSSIPSSSATSSQGWNASPTAPARPLPPHAKAPSLGAGGQLGQESCRSCRTQEQSTTLCRHSRSRGSARALRAVKRLTKLVSLCLDGDRSRESHALTGTVWICSCLRRRPRCAARLLDQAEQRSQDESGQSSRRRTSSATTAPVLEQSDKIEDQRLNGTGLPARVGRALAITAILSGSAHRVWHGRARWRRIQVMESARRSCGPRLARQRTGRAPAPPPCR
jgi:hypothetical protein